MTDPDQHTPGGPYEIVISDEVMARVKNLPPEEIDAFAAAMAQLRENPENAPGSRALVPHPITFTGRQPTYVPATRSISYLRAAVAEISEPTVATFDAELAADVTGTSPDIKIHALRQFLARWIEYIALFGDPEAHPELQTCEDPEEYGRRFAAAMRQVHQDHFRDGDGSPQAYTQQTGPDRWAAVCPVTTIRVIRPTEEQAKLALKMALLELVTGY